MRRLRLVLLLVGGMLVVAGVASGSIAQRSQSSLDQALTLEADEHAGIVANYFDRARDAALLSAQNPVFTEYYATPGAREQRLRQPELNRRISAALAYLQQLYQGSILKSCFIDGTGSENARVVRGVTVPPERLTRNRSSYPFLGPALALPVGHVHQAGPYVSPDTGEWVMSTSTAVPGLTNARAIVHFEITLESIRLAAAPSEDGYVIQIVDRSTGAGISDSRLPQRGNAPLAARADRLASRLRDQAHASGVLSLDGQRIAYKSLASHDEGMAHERGTGPHPGDWVVASSAPALSSAWTDPAAPGPIALIVAGLIALALAGLGFHRHRQRLNEHARTDELTGLANRLRLYERLSAALTDAPAANTAVLLLDLDRFKAVNDTLGHHAGDRLLAEIAARLRRAVEPHRLVARLGGDEFAVLIPRMRDDGEPERVASAVQRVIREPITFETVPIAVSASIGIVIAPEHGTDPNRLLRCADVAMYHAKRTASGYSTYADEQETHSVVKLGLEAALLAAIEQRQLVLHYQPIVDPGSGQVQRVEALVRWHHPELGLIAPRDFVSLAEEAGFSRELTLHVLQLALDQCAQWHADGLDLPVSVNLSSANCVDTQLPDDVSTMLAARNLPARVLRLEVTEYAAVAAEAADVLGRIRRFGVSLALDDFGTGYSSLAYLKLLSVDDIKIDRSFVAALAQDPTDTVIISSTIDMAHRLGCSVTAEGVEDEETLRALEVLGTDTIQGYHVCHPLPAEELRTWLRDQHQVLQA
jgi:diguanylate cyclase (GGDEF)-like protein